MIRASGWAVFLVMTFVYWIGITVAAVCAAVPAWKDVMAKEVSLPTYYLLTSQLLTSPLLLTAALLGLPIVLAIPLAVMKSDTLRAWIACCSAAIFALVPMALLVSLLVFLANAVHLILPATPAGH